ncbi:hypothetical protein [Streptomyces sp. NPDC052721]|uniref:hypothetical protein n=1 Tax=Streptomyces sp. NPDC052721 TaxID=3154955 RepID=UPI0034233A68
MMDAEVVTAIVGALSALAGAVVSVISFRVTALTNKKVGARIQAGEVFAYLADQPDRLSGEYRVCVIENRTDQLIRDVKVQVSGEDLVALAELPPGQARLQLDDSGPVAQAPLTELNSQTTLVFSDHTGFRWTRSAEGLSQLEPTERGHPQASLTSLTLVTSLAVVITTIVTVIAFVLR